MQTDDGQNILIRLLGLCFSVKIFHYRTRYYGAHKAADKFFAAYLVLADRFLEVYQGKYERIIFEESSVDMSLPVLTDENIAAYLVEESKWLASLPFDDDLKNIADELQATVNNFKYLLIFK